KKPKHDIDDEVLNWAISRSSNKELLKELVSYSRKWFGWFSKTSTRLFEYPWVIDNIKKPSGKNILDIGAGVSPLPLYIAEKGAYTYTLDNSRIIRRYSENPWEWNGWGFLDYNQLNKKVISLNCSLYEANFNNNMFDYIYSVSVIEHIPKKERIYLWKEISRILKKEGGLLLTIDLIPNTNFLWNYCESGLIESPQEHGTVEELIKEIKTNSFELLYYNVVRNIKNSKTDCAFLMFRKAKRTKESVLDLIKFEFNKHKILLGCVAENNPKYLSQALRLLQSLRWFGGKVANADFLLCSVDNIDEEYKKEFLKFNAFIEVANRFNAKHPPSNKLSFFNQERIQNYDIVMLSDCDTLIVDDFSEYLYTNVFQAKIADDQTVSPQIFEKLFKQAGLDYPESDIYYTTVTNKPTIWYCNSGVLILPKEILKLLVTQWIHYNKWLLDHMDLLGSQKFFCEQASLTLAFYSLKEKIPFQELPLGMNLPLHFDESQYPNFMKEINPVILHYHWLVDPSGYIKPSHFPKANKKIECFNERLREYRKSNMNNKIFWDFRYSNSPELGSGWGSRGLPLIYKKEIIKEIVEYYKPNSILDVGCGDSEVTSDIKVDNYLGIDISQVVVDTLRAKYPKRKYLCTDFLKVDLSEKSDLTICLDVVIHLSQKEIYQRFVKKLVNSTKHVGIISGFEKEPTIKSEITFYHEPLSITLKNSGAKNIKKIGSYRDTTIFLFNQVKEQTDIIDNKGILKKPIFIVGCMRSGTTLLANLLDKLDNIVYCPFELKKIWSQIGNVKMASPKTKDFACPSLNETDIENMRREQIDNLKKSFYEYFLCEKRRKNKDKAFIFLNKNPHLSNKLPFLNTLFPDCRVIWIRRDLFSVVASLKKLFVYALEHHRTFHYWPKESEQRKPRCWSCFHYGRLPEYIDRTRIFPFGNIKFLAEYWLETNLAVLEFKNKNNSKVIEVKYEDLVSHPEETMTKILVGLGKELIFPDGIFGCIQTDRNDGWKEILDENEKDIIFSFIEENKEQIYEISPSLLEEKLVNKFEQKQVSKSKIKTIIVLGMHRSGTSMTAGVLHRLGVNMGKNLMKGNWANPLGYFE
ncbi:MAG: sulfotransferase, partial [Candidatus Aenigmarchaeota archaeon]|nr:sulfotransferase [Candidatus Aenigmarchaeota archaeon]